MTNINGFIPSQIKKNGELYVSRPLDREVVSSYRLEVSLTDGVFVSSCRVSIEILDDNDSPPVCQRSVIVRSKLIYLSINQVTGIIIFMNILLHFDFFL